MCCKVVITNLEAGTVMDLDARKWPDAQTDDASASYKVTLGSITKSLLTYLMK